MFDNGPHESEPHAEQPHGTLNVPKGDMEPSAPVEPEDRGASNPSEWREPKGRRCDQTGLRPLTIDEHSEDEDEAEGEYAEDREGEESRDRPREAQYPSSAYERPSELIGVHKGDLTTRAGASAASRLRTA